MPRVAESDQFTFAQKVLRLMEAKVLTMNELSVEADIPFARLALAFYCDLPEALTKEEKQRLAAVLGTTEDHLLKNEWR